MFTGDEIKRKRKQQQLSAKQLAKLINVNVENLYKWEKGTRPNDPEDYLKVEKWLSGKLENVPQETTVKEEPAGYGPPPPKNLMESLLEKQNSLMAMQNRILEELKTGIQDRVNKIDSNLEIVVGKSEGLQYDLISGREVVLKSLARLEKKHVHSLLNEADKLRIDLAKQADELSKRISAGK